MTRTTPTQFWSATPTPFLEDFSVDSASVTRMVKRHIGLGVDGLLLGGTCGEGPWMRIGDLAEVVRIAADASGGGIRIAAQVTDNSARRMLGHIDRMAAAGAHYAVVASPYFLMNSSPRRTLELYLEVIRRSALPLGFYDRGNHAAYPVEGTLLPELLAEPNLKLIKDSSGDAQRREIFLEAIARRGDLLLFSGNEFRCVDALRAGYRGLLLGGGIFNARLAAQIRDAVAKGNFSEAENMQERMNELMYRVYGGKEISCWLAGLKYLLVGLGVFETPTHFLGYPLTPECRAALDEILTGPDADHYRDDLMVESAAGIA